MTYHKGGDFVISQRKFLEQKLESKRNKGGDFVIRQRKFLEQKLEYLVFSKKI